MAAVAFDELKDYERGFAAHFAQHVAPLLSDLEDYRRDQLQYFICVSIFCAAAVCGALALLWLFPQVASLGAENNMKLSLGLPFIASLWPTGIYMRYRNHAKDKLMPAIIPFFGGLQYHENTGIDKSVLLPFNILPSHQIYNSEDYINGALDGVGLELGEIHLKNRVRTKHGHREVTVFRGVAVAAAVSKPFKGMTVIRKDAGWLGNKLQGAFSNLERVSLEDPRFESKFEVYGTDQVEARYLLTTAFMERLMLLGALMRHWGADPTRYDEETALAEACSGKIAGLQASFCGGRLMLLVPCKKNLFEPGGLFTPATHLNEIRCVLYQIHLIRRIVEVLKLDQNIGM